MIYDAKEGPVQRAGWLDGRAFSMEDGKLVCMECDKSSGNREAFIKHSCSTKKQEPKPEELKDG